MTNAKEIAGARDPSWDKRIEGVVSSRIGDKIVAVVGCGSVGSFIADELCRSGVSRFILIDPDTVEWVNLTRTVYGYRDVGVPKVQALSRHLQQIFPDVKVDAHLAELQNLREQMPSLFAGVDLVVAAVDDPKANGLLDRFCYERGLRTLFVGIYKGAKGGEVVAVVPPSTPCYGCATGGVRESLADVVDRKDVVRNRDYGTNKLVAEVALGSDIHFVCTAAVKMAQSLLAADSDLQSLKDFMQAKLDEGVHYAMFGMQPTYYIFPATHGDAIGQHAFQSLWLQTTRRHDCPRCGDAEGRIPFQDA